MTSDKIAGWLQLGGGLAMIVLQIVQALQGGLMDSSHLVSGTAIAAGGIGTIVQGGKLSR